MQHIEEFGQIIAAGPITQQPSSSINRLVLLRKANGDVCGLMQIFHSFPTSDADLTRHYDLGAHQYYPDMARALDGFGTGLASESLTHYRSLELHDRMRPGTGTARSPRDGWQATVPDREVLRSRVPAARLPRWYYGQLILAALGFCAINLPALGRLSPVTWAVTITASFCCLLWLSGHLLRTLLWRRYGLENEVEFRTCPCCAAFDLQMFARPAPHPRPCPYCFPEAAERIERSQQNAGQFRNRSNAPAASPAIAAVPPAAGGEADLGDAEILPLLQAAPWRNKVYVGENGVIACGPWIESSYRLRPLLKLGEQGTYVVVLECDGAEFVSKESGTVSQQQVAYSSHDFAEAAFNFAARIAAAADFWTPNDVPRRQMGSTLSSLSAQRVWPNRAALEWGFARPWRMAADVKAGRLDSMLYCISMVVLALLGYAIVEASPSAVPDWAIVVMLLMAFALFAVPAVAVLNRIKSRWRTAELALRTCPDCQLIDGMVDSTSTFNPRPCPLCSASAATYVAVIAERRIKQPKGWWAFV